MEQLFFELLQVAVGRRVCLSRTPSPEEWQTLFGWSGKQTVMGVCFVAVQRLHSQGQVPPQRLIFEWLGAAEQIRQVNDVVTKRCKTVQKRFSDEGIRSAILKGQAIATYYGEELQQYRQSGDIDVYVDCGLQRALQFAKANGKDDTPKWDYKHLHLDVFRDTEVEVHYRVEVLLNLWKNRRLQCWLKANEAMLFDEGSELTMPSCAFNTFYILLHIYRHFLYEGVGMRQLMDYYFVLEKNDGRMPAFADGSTLEDVLRYFGMMRFAQGLMWVMRTVFNIDKRLLPIAPLESEGRFILNEVMTGGNFGHYGERQKKSPSHGKLQTVKVVCQHNLHLLRHYPADGVWAPLWFVWHKCWKNNMKRKLK